MRWNIQSTLMSIDDEDDLALLKMIVKAGYGVCHVFGQSAPEEKKSKKTRGPATIRICFTAEELTSFIEE